MIYNRVKMSNQILKKSKFIFGLFFFESFSLSQSLNVFLDTLKILISHYLMYQ